MSRQFQLFDAPFGPATIVVDEQGRLCELWTRDASRILLEKGVARGSGSTRHVADQLAGYFEGSLKRFDLQLILEGTQFQRQVWDLLQEIPYGETRTYGELAAQLGLTNGARAVGRANATNPVAIVVPCHRVIGHDGSLTGYAGGLDVKRKLLDLESGSRPLF
jgi:methylated-DNA-[protein]-cysteine S-methyltransferase